MTHVKASESQIKTDSLEKLLLVDPRPQNSTTEATLMNLIPLA
jgi:hypothetical protein